MSTKKPDPSEFVDTVRESAQQIWLAGLAAFSKAQAEGSKVFDNLVKEGADIQRKTQTTAEEKASEFSARWTGLAGDVGARAGQQWDKLESIFEDRTARALARLGVPTAKQIDALEARIVALTEQVTKLEKAAARPAPAAKRSAARSATPTAKTAKPSARKRAV